MEAIAVLGNIILLYFGRLNSNVDKSTEKYTHIWQHSLTAVREIFTCNVLNAKILTINLIFIYLRLMCDYQQKCYHIFFLNVLL